MKVRLTALCIGLAILFAAMPALAEPALEFGAKAGLTFTTQDYEYTGLPLEVDRGYATGLTLAFFSEASFATGLSVRPEIMYVQKGNKLTFRETTEEYPEGTGRTIDVVERIDYLAIQPLLKAGLPLGTASVYALAGPRMDILVRTSSDMPSTIVENHEPVLFGATFGGGVQFPLSPVMSLCLEYYYFHDFDDAYRGDVVTVKNKASAVMVGVKF